MEETMLEQPGTSDAALAALAEVARAVADDERRPRFKESPASEVEGFDALPDQVQATLTGMSLDELTVLGKMNSALLDGGFFINAGRIRLCMF